MLLSRYTRRDRVGQSDGRTRTKRVTRKKVSRYGFPKVPGVERRSIRQRLQTSISRLSWLVVVFINFRWKRTVVTNASDFLTKDGREYTRRTVTWKINFTTSRDVFEENVKGRWRKWRRASPLLLYGYVKSTDGRDKEKHGRAQTYRAR